MSRAVPLIGSRPVLAFALAFFALAEASPARATSPETPRGVPPLTDYCSYGVNTPFNRADGWIVAKGYTQCEPGEFPYRKLRVRLQQKVEGKWVIRSTEIGFATNDEPSQLVKTLWPCEVSRWRSRVAIWFRWSESDPWLVAVRRFTSPRRDVSICRAP